MYDVIGVGVLRHALHRHVILCTSHDHDPWQQLFCLFSFKCTLCAVFGLFQLLLFMLSWLTFYHNGEWTVLVCEMNV